LWFLRYEKALRQEGKTKQDHDDQFGTYKLDRKSIDSCPLEQTRDRLVECGVYVVASIPQRTAQAFESSL
jgi:hypothetical protein